MKTKVLKNNLLQGAEVLIVKGKCLFPLAVCRRTLVVHRQLKVCGTFMIGSGSSQEAANGARTSVPKSIWQHQVNS